MGVGGPQYFRPSSCRTNSCWLKYCRSKCCRHNSVQNLLRLNIRPYSVEPKMRPHELHGPRCHLSKGSGEVNQWRRRRRPLLATGSEEEGRRVRSVVVRGLQWQEKGGRGGRNMNIIKALFKRDQNLHCIIKVEGKKM